MDLTTATRVYNPQSPITVDASYTVGVLEATDQITVSPPSSAAITITLPQLRNSTKVIKVIGTGTTFGFTVALNTDIDTGQTNTITGTTATTYAVGTGASVIFASTVLGKWDVFV